MQTRQGSILHEYQGRRLPRAARLLRARNPPALWYVAQDRCPALRALFRAHRAQCPIQEALFQVPAVQPRLIMLLLQGVRAVSALPGARHRGL